MQESSPLPGVGLLALFPARCLRCLRVGSGWLASLPGMIILACTGKALSIPLPRFVCEPRGYGVFRGCKPCLVSLRG